jgi:hypothetical protein
MNRYPTGPRPEWVSGAITLAVATLVAGGAGFAVGARSWTFYVGLTAGAVLLIGWLERYWLRRAAIRSLREPRRTRTNLKVIQGGKRGNGEYDLEDDDSTDSQRWLM